MLEIERKFLVNEMPDLSQIASDEIVQGYLSFNPEIRIRIKGQNIILPKKETEHR